VIKKDLSLVEKENNYFYHSLCQKRGERGKRVKRVMFCFSPLKKTRVAE